MNKSGLGWCFASDKRWILRFWLLRLHLDIRSSSRRSRLAWSRFTTRLWSQPSTFHKNPRTSQSQHPTFVSLWLTMNLSQWNKTQLVTFLFSRTFKRVLLKVSAYWKQCNVLAWFLLENGRHNLLFLFYALCVILQYIFVLCLRFVLKGKLWPLTSNSVKNPSILYGV